MRFCGIDLQMRFCGIDLHSNSVVVVTDETDNKWGQRARPDLYSRGRSEARPCTYLDLTPSLVHVVFGVVAAESYFGLEKRKPLVA
jgi:hypothetical protein